MSLQQDTKATFDASPSSFSDALFSTVACKIAPIDLIQNAAVNKSCNFSPAKREAIGKQTTGTRQICEKAEGLF